MLQQLLMVFIAIGAICCEPNCPIYSKFKNNPSLINYLNGTFYKIIATGTVVADCQRQTFTIGSNKNIVGGYLKSPDWCLNMTNCDSSNSTQYECDLFPVTAATPPTLPTAGQRNSIKLVGKFVTDDNLCIIYSYCRISEEGVYLLCRKPAGHAISVFLEAVERWGSFITPLKRVEQVNCSFPNSCPP